MIDAEFKEYVDSGVSVFYQGVLPFDQKVENTTSWVLKVIKQHSYSVSALNYIFCTDDQLHKINLEHLGHDTYTDIITFDYSDDDGVVESDIYISLDRVKENAEDLGKSFDEELHRVLIHGVLHLIGYDDKTQKEKLEMRKKENTCLSLR